MNILGSKVVLRAVEREDVEKLRDIMNDPEVERLVVGWSFPVSKMEQEKWYEKALNDRNNLRLAIEILDTGELIGITGLWDIDWKNRKAYSGIKIGSVDYRGKGYGQDALVCTMKYAFEELQLNRLETEIIEYNKASYNLYCRKCGWKEEGRKRKSVFKNNGYHDMINIGILREEYLAFSRSDTALNQ